MRIKTWIRGLLAFVLLAGVASLAFTRYLQTNSARRYLIAHLATSFGRPVDVRKFEFSFLDGARLEANSLTVAEDPRFGNEYFLRADNLTAGVNWLALLSGRFEFGTLSLSQPSLNLVRDREGRWNIEDWLPPVSTPAVRPGFVGPRVVHSIVRLIKIQFAGGRINFKQGDDKTPFALQDVSGTVAENIPGRWQLDLESVPMRAGVNLQDGGTLRLRGTIGGTTTRLQPADLNLTWRDVSMADVLRMTRQTDSGVRGELEVDLNAHVEPAATGATTVADKPGAGRWAISGSMRLTGIHRWDLPERANDPGLNLSVDASWRLGDRHAQIEKILMEMPKSHLQGSADLDWAHGFRPEFHIESSSLGLSDVLNAYRAFRRGVPENLSVDGVIGLDATLAGWPLQLQQGALASAGARLSGPSLPSDLQIGEINASVARGVLDFAPTDISFAEPATKQAPGNTGVDAEPPNSITLLGSISPGKVGTKPWPPSWNMSINGKTDRIQDWQALSQTLAQPSGAGWVAAGGIEVKLTATHRSDALATIWIGTLDTHSLTVSPVFLNQPLRFPKAHVDFAQSQRSVIVNATEAFGATWRGTISKKALDLAWTFDLSADKLDAADLDRWLGPRARPGFFARLTNLGGANTNAADSNLREAVTSRIVARGRLRVGQVEMAPLQVGQLDATLNLAGRKITVENASADFFGGKVAASFTADLVPDPLYQFNGTFDSVNLNLLGRAVPALRDRISGTAGGIVMLSAHGVGQDNLMQSIAGNGSILAKDAQLTGIDLAPVLAAPPGDPIPAHFVAVRGKFQFSRSGIEISDFVLDHPPSHLVAEGHIELSRALDIQIHTVASSGKLPPAAAESLPIAFSLGGTVDAPKWVSAEPPSASQARVSEYGK